MKKITQKSALSEHQSRASKARHAKRTPEERSAHAKMMVEAREAKRKRAREAQERFDTKLNGYIEERLTEICREIAEEQSTNGL